jgi:hypothetical protein
MVSMPADKVVFVRVRLTYNGAIVRSNRRFYLRSVRVAGCFRQAFGAKYHIYGIYSSILPLYLCGVIFFILIHNGNLVFS